MNKDSIDIDGLGSKLIDKLVDSNSMPSVFSLENLYPNPFNPILNIDFSMPETNNVNITIYDINGRIIDKVFIGELLFGYHNIKWNAEKYSSGIYFVKLSSDNFIESKKVILLK